jgi:hypothetical protein
MPKEKRLAKRYKFSQEELKVMSKWKGLDKIYKFSQEELKSCAKRQRFNQKVHSKEKGLANIEV